MACPLIKKKKRSVSARNGEQSPVRRRQQTTTEKVSADGEEQQEEQQDTALELNAEAAIDTVTTYTVQSAAQTQQLVNATNSLSEKLQSANSIIEDAASSTKNRMKTGSVGCKTSVVIGGGTRRRNDDMVGDRDANRIQMMSNRRNEDNSVPRDRGGLGVPANDDSQQQQHSNGSSGNASAGQH